MRLSRITRQPDPEAESEAVPARRVILWMIVGAAVLWGLVLFFRYARRLSPLVD